MILKLILKIALLLLFSSFFYAQQAPIPAVEKPKDVNESFSSPFLTACIDNGFTIPLSPSQKKPVDYFGGISGELSAGFIHPFTINLTGDFYPYLGLGTSARLYIPGLMVYFGLGVKGDYDYLVYHQWNGLFFLESGLKILFFDKNDGGRGGFFIEPIVEAGWRQPLGQADYKVPADQISSHTNQGGIITGNLETSFKICLGYMFN
jgi:hypothetical protein